MALIPTDDAAVQPDADGLVSVVAEALLPTRFGRFRVAVIAAAGAECLVLLHGDPLSDDATLVRLHSECLTGDVFGSLRCDCGEQLDKALSLIAGHGSGVMVYLEQEGRGIGLTNKIRAYSLQDQGADTVDANLALGLPVDDRQYGCAATALRALGVTRVRLLTNNPRKCSALEAQGIIVVERVPLAVHPNPFNAGYLRTKVTRMGHLIAIESDEDLPGSA